MLLSTSQWRWSPASIPRPLGQMILLSQKPRTPLSLMCRVVVARIPGVRHGSNPPVMDSHSSATEPTAQRPLHQLCYDLRQCVWSWPWISSIWDEHVLLCHWQWNVNGRILWWPSALLLPAPRVSSCLLVWLRVWRLGLIAPDDVRHPWKETYHILVGYIKDVQD